MKNFKKMIILFALTTAFVIGRNVNESQAIKQSQDLLHQIELQMVNSDSQILGNGVATVTLKVNSGGYIRILAMEGANFWQKKFLQDKLSSFRIEDAFRFTSETYSIDFNF